MTLDQAVEEVSRQFERMERLYGKLVFDEWALVAVRERRVLVLHYAGPRRDDLVQVFEQDLHEFGAELMTGGKELGNYDFARFASGTHFDAYLVVGDECFLFCNNTTQSIAGITRDPRWLNAQVPFVELSEHFRTDPLVYP